MSCNSCVMCFAMVGVAGVTDGYYKRVSEEGSAKWFGLDGKQVAAALNASLEGAYAAQTRVDCSLYESQINAESRFVLLEEIDSTTKQPTGTLVQVETKPDGSLVYTNMATGAIYAAPAGTELVKEEDSDFELVRTLGCDAGTSIEKREWFKVGVALAVASAVINVATGAAHALSGAETWGSYCVAGTKFTEPTLVCAKLRTAAAPAAIPAGTNPTNLYRVVEYSSTTGAPVATKYYKQADNSEVTVGDAAGNYWVDDSCC